MATVCGLHAVCAAKIPSKAKVQDSLDSMHCNFSEESELNGPIVQWREYMTSNLVIPVRLWIGLL